MERLKRNWKIYLGIGIFLFLYWYFLPLQSEFYLERDLIDFTLIETLIIVGIVFLISLIVFYRFLSDEKDKVIRISQAFAFSVFIGFFYAFVIQGIVISLGLLLNRITENGQITERFEITYVKNDNVGIRSLEDPYFEETKNKFTESELKKINQGDSISIVFQKGILNKKYFKSGKIKIVK